MGEIKKEQEIFSSCPARQHVAFPVAIIFAAAVYICL